jgi:hypothetical protein
MSVPRISRISIEARRLFCKPNCSGVKAKLKMRLRRKGKAVRNVTSFLQSLMNTFPNEIAIKM